MGLRRFFCRNGVALGWAAMRIPCVDITGAVCAVDMLEEPVSGDEGEDAAGKTKKGKKKRQRNQQ